MTLIVPASRSFLPLRPEPATMSKSKTTIPLSRDTLNEVKSLKRGGESYDDLLSKMAASYDPDGPGGDV